LINEHFALYFKKKQMEIYLDYNATTPLDPEVAEAMHPYLGRYFGNPSSNHFFGLESKKAIEKARKQVSTLIHCQPHEIIFTSGGTESNNYAIKGIAMAPETKGNHIITSAIEHPSVLEVCKHLEKKGFHVTYLPVDPYGSIHIDNLKKAICRNTFLITLMHANNEIGTIQPVEQMAAIAKENGVLFHSDAAQSAGKIPINIEETAIDLLSLAGHKLYAPKGIGALFIREGIKLEKLIHGGDHERNLRAGTENVMEIVALGKACEIAARDMAKNQETMKQTRDALYQKFQESLPAIKRNGHPQQVLPNTLSISFPSVEANILVNELSDNGIAASAGAACHSDQVDVSQVLTAIGLEETYAMGTIRFSTGKETPMEEIVQSARFIIDAVLSMTSGEPAPSAYTGAVKLTHYTQGMGCACKLRPRKLEEILDSIPLTHDPNVLIDTRTSDDAAVYRINREVAVAQTLDFFTPIVDKPYDFGAVAAANALSDLYAMGADPLFGLNIVGFPSKRLPMSVLQEILKGARDKAEEAGISIIGGHSIEDREPKYGLVVTGKVHPAKILKNTGAQVGDTIILTKPLGTGILSTASKKGLADESAIKKLTSVMVELNKTSAEILKKYPVNACTDVTGFGLLGHLSEMTLPENINAQLDTEKVPVIQEARAFAGSGIIPGGTKSNYDHMQNKTEWGEGISHIMRYILCDAQTSGGLLFALPQQYEKNIIADMKQAGISHASAIGRFTRHHNGQINIV